MLKLEETKKKNQAEIKNRDRDIASWAVQIRELQAKITEAEKRKDEILKFDDASMAKELDFGFRFI